MTSVSLVGGLTTGNWAGELVDQFSNVMDESPPFAVTYLISSFTCPVTSASTALTGLTATLSSSSESITGSFAAVFILTSSPFTTYSLTAASISGAVVTFSNLSGGK